MFHGGEDLVETVECDVMVTSRSGTREQGNLRIEVLEGTRGKQNRISALGWHMVVICANRSSILLHYARSFL